MTATTSARKPVAPIVTGADGIARPLNDPFRLARAFVDGVGAGLSFNAYESQRWAWRDYSPILRASVPEPLVEVRARVCSFIAGDFDKHAAELQVAPPPITRSLVSNVLQAVEAILLGRHRGGGGSTR